MGKQIQNYCGNGCGKPISQSKVFCWACKLLRKDSETPEGHPQKAGLRELLKREGLTPMAPRPFLPSAQADANPADVLLQHMRAIGEANGFRLDPVMIQRFREACEAKGIKAGDFEALTSDARKLLAVELSIWTREQAEKAARARLAAVLTPPFMDRGFHP